ncbi:MAG: Hsp20/alpha crystallin family protein [Acidobacteria bacterium]|nr:Hsp20/alpha crystallin family protein [Acidobacteriota bacterium]
MTLIRRYKMPMTDREICPECFPFYGSMYTKKWVPAIDIFEKDNGLVIKMEATEMDTSNIELNVENFILTIKGKRERTDESEGTKFHRKERWYGEFNRSFTLPDAADTTNIDAAYNDGVLTVQIPYLETKTQKNFKVEIK